MLRAIFRVLVESGEEIDTPGATSDVIGIVKCAPSRVALWPFTQRETSANVRATSPFSPAFSANAGEAEETIADGPAPAAPLGLRASLLHKPLWNAGDAEADHHWSHVLMPQLREVLGQLQDDLMRAGAWSDSVVAQRPWLGYPAVDVVIDPLTISVENQGSREFSDVPAALQLVRRGLSAGLVPEDTVRIEVPCLRENPASNDALKDTAPRDGEEPRAVSFWRLYRSNGTVEAFDPAEIG